MKKYLISGIPPSHGGVGYLMSSLVKLADKYGYKTIIPGYINESIRKNILNPFFVIKELYKRKTTNINFKNKINNIKNSEVILIHPQIIGLNDFIFLVENNSIVKMYVMDNSFFCIKSYNVLDNKECLKCLEDSSNCDDRCQPFPIRYKKDNNFSYLKQLKKLSSKIIFYAQNESQKKLLIRYFGLGVKILVIGMQTDEKLETYDLKNNSKSYDIVFHGANIEAKGINYCIDLAKKLPQYSFFVPSMLNLENLPKNITHANLTWNNGLKDIVVSAKLVLNPSLWSAPVEGALLKSIFYNKNVAVVENKYGFINDIPNKVILKLSNNTMIAVNQIIFLLEKNTSLKQNNWLSEYFMEQCKINLLFEDVEKAYQMLKIDK